MTEVSTLEIAARRRVARFEQKHSAALLHLAYHAALPAALTPDLVHLLRINFFFDGSEALPYTAEADMLLSPLCTEIGDELYEMDHEVRDMLLLELTARYGRGRLREVAALLWQYDQHIAPWTDNDMLERAQQLTALSFLDPTRARQWLTLKSTDQHSLEQKVWFTAMSNEVSLAEKIPSLFVEQTEPPISAEPVSSTLNDEITVDQPQTIIDESEAVSIASSSSEPPIDSSVVSKPKRVIDRELYNQLVTLVLKIPAIENFNMRSVLLTGIPFMNLSRDPQSTRHDIPLLIDQLMNIQLENGQWALLVFIDNIIPYTNSLLISEQLKELRHQFDTVYEQKEQDLFIQGENIVQNQTNAAKKNNMQKKRSTASGGKNMASQPESDITSRLKELKKIIVDIEYSLDMIPPRLHTLTVLTAYEENLQKVLSALRNEIPLERSEPEILPYLRDARDELSLAIQEIGKKGVNREFIRYIRQCRNNLKNVLGYWP